MLYVIQIELNFALVRVYNAQDILLICYHYCRPTKRSRVYFAPKTGQFVSVM